MDMKNMNTNRGLTLTSLLIGLLVVVVLISGILYLWQSSALAPGDGTATSTPAHPDWTTYNDPNGKFSFQYPKTFSSHVWTTRTPWPPVDRSRNSSLRGTYKRTRGGRSALQ
jgi:hypothetical protein